MKKPKSSGFFTQNTALRYVSRLPFHFCFLFVLFSGCNDSFEPLQKNDKYFFSIFGYLDATADTQWVRVSPARQQLELPAEVPDMQVTLKHLETGDTVTLKDSLFGVGSGFNYINFYTLEDIEPAQTYLVKAEGADGKSSQVTVKTPDEFPTQRLLEDTSFWTDEHIYKIIINGADNIVDVQTWWFVHIKAAGVDETRKYVFSYRNRLEHVNTYGGAYIAEFIYEEEEDAIMNKPLIRLSPDAEVEILHRQVYVANGGPDWNKEIESLDDLLYAQPEVISNVENGLGYMVGVYSKVVPYETCKDEIGGVAACQEEEPFW